MSIITTAAAAAVTAAASSFAAERRERLQKAFTDAGGAKLLDVAKLTVAETDQAAGLIVLTDGTANLAVTRDRLALVVKVDGRWVERGAFTSLLELGLLLAAR